MRGWRTKPASRNQVQIAASGSLLPLWEKARMRVRRAQARLCGREFRRKPTPVSPSHGRGLGRVRRAQARLGVRRLPDSRFRGNDGAKIGNNSAIIASLRPLRLRAIASNSLCRHDLGRVDTSLKWTNIAPSPPILRPSFPRKRESRRLQPNPSPETKPESQPADPFSLHGRRLG